MYRRALYAKRRNTKSTECILRPSCCKVLSTSQIGAVGNSGFEVPVADNTPEEAWANKQGSGMNKNTVGEATPLASQHEDWVSNFPVVLSAQHVLSVQGSTGGPVPVTSLYGSRNRTRVKNNTYRDLIDGREAEQLVMEGSTTVAPAPESSLDTQETFHLQHAELKREDIKQGRILPSCDIHKGSPGHICVPTNKKSRLGRLGGLGVGFK